MGFTVPTAEPTRIVAGDSLQWDRALSDYPPSEGWTLSYVLSGAESSVLDISTSASDDGLSYEVRVAPTDTQFYDAGRYTLVGFVKKADGTRYEVFRGPCVVIADAATAAPDVGFNERMLAAVEAKIADRIAADISGYTAEQQAVQREDLASLHRQRNRYAEAVRRERGGSFFQDVKVRFGAAA